MGTLKAKTPNLSDSDFDALPGGTLICDGLTDLRNGTPSVRQLLLFIGAPRQRRLGFDIPPYEGDPEHELYDLLADSNEHSAHSRYKALIRTLMSFGRAAECVNPINQ
jgi:hypothetical protein